MSALTSIPAAELADLKERLNRLAREKAQLQLIALLMNRLSELPGLEKTVEGMLQFVMEILGGLNVTIYYRLDDAIHRVDVYGRREVYGEVEDDLVRQAFETHRFVSRERDFSQTGMATPEFTKATTWVMPLLVGAELVGVLRMDDLIVADRELREEVQTFIRYASLVLKNEISEETRLRRALDEVSRVNRDLRREVAERKRAEGALQRAKDLLERRVAERTAELTIANERLRVELAERARAEGALAKQHSTLRGIIEGTTSPVFSLDREFRYVAFNRSHVSAMRALYGAEIEVGQSLLDYMTVSSDRETARRNLDRVLAGEHLVEAGYSGEEAGTRRYFEISHHPVHSSDGSVIGAAVFANDVTERQRADEDRQAHLRFLEHLDQINRALRGTNDLEQMMSDVLDAALSVFECDRAWIVYPCDPDAATYTVPMERTRPEYPGALARGIEVPVDRETAQLLRALQASIGPVTFDPGSEPPLPALLTERFHVLSQIAVAVYPKVSKPYVFGLHQCSYRRIWTPEDARLLQEIGRRLSDSLTSLLTYRDLKESEERYRTLIQKIQAAVVVHGADTRVVTSNLLAQELLGLSEDQLSGKTAADQAWRFNRADGSAMPPEEYPVNRVRATRKAVKDLVARIHRPASEEARDVWVLVNADPVFGRDDEVLQVIVTFIDITKLQRAEAALRESEERYRLIAENTADTITVLDFDLRFTYVSPSALKLRGYTVDETMAQSLDQVFTPASLQEVTRLFSEQMALEASGTADPSRAASLELEEYCKDGSTIWVEVAVSFLRDPALRPTGILAVTRDITGRKKADLQLVESEQKFRSLADSSPDNIIRYDADARLVYVNPNMDATVGFDLGSRPGLTPSESDPGPESEDYEKRLRRVIQSGEPDELEATVPNPAGEMRIHSIRFVAERSNDGRIIGALAFGRDVTERKEAAREKQKYLVQLRQNLEDAVTAIAATVEARDPYTAGHQRRVAALAAAIAKELGLADEAVQGIHLAGTIHDLGKIKVPAEILARPGQLSEIEARLIQIHPEAGWEILKGVEFPWPIAEMVLEHHERLDGSGYPKGLEGEQISLGARILAVADVVEAMASHRPYRPSRGLGFALSEIERDREARFDAAVVDACLRLFHEKGYQLPD